ncbi:Hypothetical predicted protein, partial [Marmota monax]
MTELDREIRQVPLENEKQRESGRRHRRALHTKAEEATEAEKATKPEETTEAEGATEDEETRADPECCDDTPGVLNLPSSVPSLSQRRQGLDSCQLT